MEQIHFKMHIVVTIQAQLDDVLNIKVYILDLYISILYIITQYLVMTSVSDQEYFIH